MSFESLGLSAELLRAVEEQGYTVPTPVQEQVIPAVLAGVDILAGSQTGTGKTASFTLPLLERILKGYRPRGPVRALILTPTRELAAQVAKSVKTYGSHLPIKSTVIFGGTSINSQIRNLRAGADIIVATPGRLLDHVMQKTVDLSKVEVLILDEADRMLDMGFIHDIRKLISFLPKTRQNLLFSATFSDEIKRFADGLFHNPKKIQIARTNEIADLVTEVMYPVDTKRKRALLTHLIHSKDMKQVLVFTRTKHGANKLSEQLEMDGISTGVIHGNKSQSARTKALANFKQGAVQVLVATDVAARGIDIDQLPFVVNFEIPNVPEDYVHRIGRTGRAGNAGEAISLVSIDEQKFLKDIEKLLNRAIPKVLVPGFEPNPLIKAEPVVLRSGSQRRGPSTGNFDRHGRSESNNRFGRKAVR